MVARTRQHRLPTSLADAFGGLQADYAAAKSSRFQRKRTGISPLGSGADYHYRSEGDYLKLMELARDMDRNDSIVGQTVNRACDNIIQDGFALDTQTGDPKLDADLDARWTAWANDPDECDFAGQQTFYDMEWQVMRSMLVDGDVFALPTVDGALQLTEAHRCRTPKGTRRNVVHGVLLDEQRRRLEYWFTRDDVDPMATVKNVAEMHRYAARDEEGHRQVFHIYDPKRVSQTRGVTAFAPIFDCLGMFEDINFAKLVQQQVVSCFAILRTRDLNSQGGIAGQRGAETQEQDLDGTTRTIAGIAPGMEVFGRPGEKLQGFAANVPNAEFFQHVKLILTLVGINLGLPLALVLLDASETNFSGWRGAVDQARVSFRRKQKWEIKSLHTPTYRWKVRQWMAEDAALRSAAARSGINIFGHRWNPPRWAYIQPLQEATADLLQIRNALTSPRRNHASRGQDWEEIAVEIVADNAFAIRKAKEEAARINTEYPDHPVHWRELLSLPTPDGVTVSVGGPAGDAAATPGKPQEAA